MPNRSLRLALMAAALLAAVVWVAAAGPAQAAGRATFTLTAKSAYLRSAPSLSAPRVKRSYSVASAYRIRDGAAPRQAA